MATVFDVAKYIVDNAAPLSTMKLQKLCFYSQAMSLVWDDEPLFDDDFEAWAKGPVCRKLFEAHKGVYSVNNSSFLDAYHPDVNRLTNDQKETIDTVLASLKDLPAYKLSQLTHQEAPWLNARKGLSPTAYSKNIISKKDMEEYYAEHWA